MTDTLQAVEQAQERIGRAMDLARAGEDRQLASLVREKGEQLARLLAGTIRMTRIHDLDNQAFEAPLRELCNYLRELHDLLGTVHLVMVEDQVYVNDIRVRFDLGSTIPTDLSDTWRRHQVGGLSFHEPLEPEQLKAVIARAAGRPEGEHPRAAFAAFLREIGLASLELQPPFRFRIKGEEHRQVVRDVQEVYRRSRRVLGEVWTNLAVGRSPNAVPVRRLVTELADMPAEDQELEVVTSAHDATTPAPIRHALQVAALAVMLGREAGLPDSAISDLGVAACFHDAGYAADEGGYPPPFERHGTAGARLLLKQRGFHEARIRRLLVCLQHHRRYDDPRGAALFARIIHIADDYESFTRFRENGPLLAPPDAIARMYAARGTHYDPVLMQLFVNRLGCFPPGSILELKDGRWVLVISGVRRPRWFAQPLTQVVRLADGTFPDEPAELDLAVEGEVRRVVRPAEPLHVED